MQTHDEVLRVFDEYQRGYATPDLILDGDNGRVMYEFVAARWGVVSITYLIEAEKMLGDKLARKPQPKVPTQAEIQAAADAKSEERMRKDYLQSLKPQHTLEQEKLSRDKLAENKRLAAAKELKDVNASIDSEINSYFVGNPNRGIDYSRTESGQQTMKAARDQHDRRTIDGARNALQAVREVKSRL
jgi:hypothetical protein